MSREALLSRETLTAGARPLAAAGVPRFPDPRRMDLPCPVFAVYAGSMYFFVAAILSLVLASGPMPLIYAVFGFAFFMFFGVMNLVTHIPTVKREVARLVFIV